MLMRLAAETLGMFVYVLLGAGTLASARELAGVQGRPLTDADWLVVGFAHGLALFLAIIVARRVSGAHINPAVTLTLACLGRALWSSVPGQLVAQYVGATLGAVAILVVFGQNAATSGHLGAPSLAAQTTLAQDTAVEALGTGVLMLTILGAADSDAPVGWGALATGLAVAAVTFFLGPVTSAAINPARAFGPDVVFSFFSTHVSWLGYIVADTLGPLLGAGAAALVYWRILRPPVRRSAG